MNDLNILDFGADPTGRTPSSRAIQAALDSANGHSPIRVIVPSGRFITGLLHPRSHTEIHLADGALLQADPDYSSHEYAKKVGGILLAQDLEDIAITGPGEINGNEDCWFDFNRSRTYIDFDVSSIRQGAGFVDFPSPFPDGPVEPLRRPGNLLIFSNCRGVRLQGFRVKGSAYWTIHLADCAEILAEDLSINHQQRIPNNDGIHLSSCRKAVLRNLDIRCGDDAIALTGFRDLKGEPEIELGFRNLEGELSDIRIEHCTLSSRSSAIRIGYGTNSMSDIRVHNVRIEDSNRGILLQSRDAGSISDVHFRDIEIKTRYMAGSWWGNGEPISISAIQRLNPDYTLGQIENISFENIRMQSPSPVCVYAAEPGQVRDVRFTDCRMQKSTDPLESQKGGTIDLRPVHDPKLALLNTEEPLLFRCHAGGSKGLSGLVRSD